MVVRSKNSNTKTGRVEFVSYNGEYPNLCSGVLVLKIDGVEYKFGHNYAALDWNNNIYKDEDPTNPNFDQFWSSGGCVTVDKDWNFEVEEGDWLITVEDLPEQFWDVADEIDKVINENIPNGCCGGCT